MKMSENVFDYITEKLYILDYNKIKKLSNRDYAIFRWGRGTPSRTTFGVAFIIGIIFGFIIGVIVWTQYNFLKDGKKALWI